MYLHGHGLFTTELICCLSFGLLLDAMERLHLVGLWLMSKWLAAVQCGPIVNSFKYIISDWMFQASMDPVVSSKIQALAPVNAACKKEKTQGCKRSVRICLSPGAKYIKLVCQANFGLSQVSSGKHFAPFRTNSVTHKPSMGEAHFVDSHHPAGHTALDPHLRPWSSLPKRRTLRDQMQKSAPGTGIFGFTWLHNQSVAAQQEGHRIFTCDPSMLAYCVVCSSVPKCFRSAQYR